MNSTKTISNNNVVLNYKQFKSIYVLDSLTINNKPVSILNCAWNNFEWRYSSTNRLNKIERRIVTQILKKECNKVNKISIALNVTKDSNYQWAYHIAGSCVSKQLYKYGSWSGKKKDGNFTPLTGSSYISIEKAKQLGWDLKSIWENGKITTNA